MIQHQPHLTRRRTGHLVRDTFEMALDEHKGHHQLQENNRKYQDQCGATIKPTGHIAFEPIEIHG